MNMEWHRLDPKPEKLACFLEKKRLDPAFTVSDIMDVNIYKHHPSELLGPASIQSNEQGWFACKLENKYGKSDTLISRKAIGGSWKKTGEDHPVEATDSNTPILIKKILVFYKGHDFRKENKTNWVMHEYSDHNSNKQGQYVLCFIKRNPDKKRKPSRIERKPGKKRKTSSSLEERQPSDSLAYDSGYNVAQDISEVEPQLPQNLHFPSSSDNDVANSNLMEVECQQQLNQNISHVTKNIFPELGSQLLPNQHMSPVIGDHVANAILSQIQLQLESQLLPNQHMSPIIGDHVGNAILSQVRRPQLVHYSTSGLDPNSFSALPVPIYPLPESSNSSGFSNYSTSGLDQNSFSALPVPIYPPPESSYSSGFSNYSTGGLDHNSFSALPVPINPPPESSYSSGFSNQSTNLQFPIHPLLESSYSSGFSNDSTSGPDHNSFSALPVPIYPPPESSYSSGFSNYSTSGLDHNSSSALTVPINPPPESLYSSGFSNHSTNLQFPIHPLLESSYSSGFSNDSTSGLDHNSFSALPSPIYPPPESSYSSGFNNDSTNGLDHNSLSGLQFPIHPPLESSYSSRFSNDSTSGLDHNSFSAVPVPIYPPPESSYSSGFSNDSTNGLDHNSLSGLQLPIHPLPESSYSSGYSNDATDGLNHNSFSALQLPVHPQPGSSHSSGISNGSNVWNPQFAAEQEARKMTKQIHIGLSGMISLCQKLDTLFLPTPTHQRQSREVIMLIMAVMQSLRPSLHGQMSILQWLMENIISIAHFES
ncbi:hypothetical protein Ddye_002452 [Dipteronia dyeriana]|uniref:NAC domain-containing protein n=1 Tax=Dipteronia dyeriana TaxID=168575 RepID=A0AAD9XRS3_9ROSI|nr:hypothetical protein Ddye_002452 [Dipteronia dyeriana]